ncbi:hypothetical protein DBR43_09610 [Pedobacter sp. KBW06]|uniref:RagB/SusD family nutrient uptake outer membrane protein n=1 Tax=Pedobacter sp. KBW06 TaxID=2153359 RepID=UPI000F59E851|nr:RagB/SusD family nutrient uptake outer membrane protein [Pedobacter sp. KBW06]RQO75583.1 hypothetical protein DBR43_09610 [Pedobacter sp. KBW06]
MTKRITLALALVGLCMISCKKYLEEIPNKKLSIPVNLADFQLLLNNTRDLAVTPGLGDIASDDLSLTSSTYRAQTILVRNLYLWKSYVFSANQNTAWSNMYRSILYANAVLEGLEKIEVNSSDRSTYNDLEGQALFLRANAFYSLQETFGQIYQRENASTSLGVPLKLSSNLTERYTRATVEETYTQIIKDLEKAAVLLPTKFDISTRFRPTQAAAYGLLSRVYLSLGEYDKAENNAANSLSIYAELTDYNKLEPSPDISPFKFLINEVVHYTRSEANLSTPSINEELYNTYDDTDLRKTLFFRFNKTTEKFEFIGSYAASQSGFSGIATDELLLIKSECLARRGETQEALNVLNKLLEKRYKAGSVFRKTAVDAEQALSIILLERRKELVFRGIRWIDLRRLNRDPSTQKTLRRVLDNEVYELKPNDPKYAFPIPEEEIRLSGIPQNIR